MFTESLDCITVNFKKSVSDLQGVSKQKDVPYLDLNFD